MPELPDITVYLEALERRILGHELLRIRLANPFLLRSVEPPVSDAEGRRALQLRRLGKRIAIQLEGDVWLVLHLMVAGRLRWREPEANIPKRRGLAAFDFENGCLILTEAGTKKRASLHIVSGEEALSDHDPGGIEPLEVDLREFAEAITGRNHTLKRALTDPRILSGIGNAYSDEIPHRAKLSPVRWTQCLTADEITRLFEATRATLGEWIDTLRQESGDGFPDRVTAFRDDMAVHERFGQPCPECGSPVQRIRYADNETNYCATCQTAGRLLADRALSRLLGKDWPQSLEELERVRAG
jgi:formamidopyrimidine-DNA glycosylase